MDKDNFKQFHNKKRLRNENKRDYIELYFNKRYDFYSENKWYFPNSIYTETNWQIEQFLIMKNQLNEVKGQLDRFNLVEWSLHTKNRDPSGYIIKQLKKYIKPEILTQAWCKFYECINQFPIIPFEAKKDNKLNSLHLCEAPGAFVSALNHYLATNCNDLQWDWLINSLNPEYEGNNLTCMIPDKRLMDYTRSQWIFGSDNSGDLMKFCNYKSIISDAKKLGKILLVTADGSVNCMSNPGEQESLVAHLHYCEVITALTVLAKGGSFVIKMFTMFESPTICLMYLLFNCFESLHVYKPCTSKSGNSEVYIVCLNYNAKEEFMILLNKFLIYYENPNSEFSMIPLRKIPTIFISQIEECSMYFMLKQIKTINDNVDCFKKTSQNNEKLKNLISKYFVSKYKIKSLDDTKYLTNKKFSNNLDLIILNDFQEENTNFILFGTEHSTENIKLNFVIGKEVSIVYYSEFCDIDYFKTLQSIQEKMMFNIFTDLLQNSNTNIDFIIRINFTKDNKINCASLFNQFFNVIPKITQSSNLVIIGAVFLTRFEASLLFLFLYCFSSVQYYAGILLLKNASERVQIVYNLFNEIYNRINEISCASTKDFIPSLLNILPNHLLRNQSYIKFLFIYNNSTLDYFFNHINVINEKL